MLTAISVILCLVALTVIVACACIFSVWVGTTIPDAYVFRPMQVDELPSADRAFLDPLINALCDQGFEVVANIKVAPYETVSSVAINFVHRGAGDMATVMRTSTGGCVVGFDTQFADGSRIVTLNQSYPDVFPFPPSERRISFSRVHDARVLYQIHRCRLQAFAPTGILVDAPELGADVERMHRDHSRYVEWLIAAGYFRATDRGYYRTTFKGAVLISWRLTPPVRWMIAWSARQGARAELRILGFNAFSPVVAASQS